MLQMDHLFLNSMCVTEAYSSRRTWSVKRRNRHTAKRYLIEQRKYECGMCGNPGVWNNRPLKLLLDFIDGDHNNQQPNNVRWLCPLCKSTLDHEQNSSGEMPER